MQAECTSAIPTVHAQHSGNAISYVFALLYCFCQSVSLPTVIIHVLPNIVYCPITKKLLLLVLMCRMLRAAYVKNGGSDSRLLMQLAAAEKKAVAMMNRQQTGTHQAGVFYRTVFFSI